jgi:hypothetical protein
MYHGGGKMEDRLWMVIWALSQRFSRWAMGEEGDMNHAAELGTRVATLLSTPDVDLVQQVVWGHRMGDADETHPLVERFGANLSKKGGVVTYPLSFRGGHESIMREGWMEADWEQPRETEPTDNDPEDERLDRDFEIEDPGSVEDVVETLRLIEREISLTPFVIKHDGEWIENPEVKRLLSELKYVNDEASWNTAPRQPTRDDGGKGRVLEANVGCRSWTLQRRGESYVVKGESTIDAEEAARASASAGGGFSFLDEERARLHAWSDFLSDAETARAGRNGGNQVAVYLLPEYPHDDNEIKWVLEHKMGEEGLNYLAQMVLQGTTDTGLKRIAQLAAPALWEKEGFLRRLREMFLDGVYSGVGPVGPAALRSVIKAMDEIRDWATLSPTEQGSLALQVSRAISNELGFEVDVTEELLDLLADRGLDLDDEDVQFYAEPGSMDLAELPHPMVRPLQRITDPIGEFCKLIEAVPGGKPWHSKASRRAEARAALRSSVNWKTASRAGMQAWRATQPAVKPAPQRRELLVQELRSTGLTDGNGVAASWDELLSGTVQVVFDTPDGGQRLKRAIVEHVKHPSALEWASAF